MCADVQRTHVVENNEYIIYIAPKNDWLVLNVNLSSAFADPFSSLFPLLYKAFPFSLANALKLCAAVME